MSEHADMIHVLDMKYFKEPVPCPNEGQPIPSQNGKKYSEHGNMQVHGSGAFIVCGRCGYQEPVGRL